MENVEILVEEEFDIASSLEVPHLLYYPISPATKKRVAVNVYSRDPESILLISASGLGTDSVFAGLNEKHIEYIAKNAPSEYKKEILRLVDNPAEIRDVLSIAKSLDEDMGGDVKVNLERVRNVIQYIRDNRAVFYS